MSFATNEELYEGLDLRSSEERRKTNNAEAAVDPQPGDWWHEMFSPVSLVIARVGSRVATFEHYIQHKDGYSYDTANVTWYTLADFGVRVRYSDVVRRSRRLKVIEQWRAEGGQL